MQRIPYGQCLIYVSLGDVWGAVLSHEIFDRTAVLTQVSLEALCDKVETLNA
jgi:hypothetical protein